MLLWWRDVWVPLQGSTCCLVWELHSAIPPAVDSFGPASAAESHLAQVGSFQGSLDPVPEQTRADVFTPVQSSSAGQGASQSCCEPPGLCGAC